MVVGLAGDDRDPRRWVTLAILLSVVILVTIDTTVLDVAFPTILHELNTTVPTLQWVVTGYALGFAAQ